MRFKVPQDVQREDRIIGPLTLKQMGMLGIGGGFAYLIYVSLSKTYFIEIWLPPVAIVSAITLAFTFLKIHNLPFHLFLMNFIEYKLLPNQRIWIQGSGRPFITSTQKKEKKMPQTMTNDLKPKNKKSIEELTKVLDTHGKSELKQKELTKEEKKEGLNEIINQNYKNEL